MERDSMVFYRSFMDSILKLELQFDADTAMQLFKAIAHYGIDGVQCDMIPIVDLMFTTIKPQIDANTKRFIDGKKGGRPKKPEKPLGLFKTEAKRINLDSDSVNDSKKGNVDSFNRFWEMYEKKVDKMKCTKLWIKLSEEEKNDIFAKLPIYKNSTPDIKFRKNPTTWLNGKCWLDIEETELKPKKYYPHL